MELQDVPAQEVLMVREVNLETQAREVQRVFRVIKVHKDHLDHQEKTEMTEIPVQWAMLVNPEQRDQRDHEDLLD